MEIILLLWIGCAVACWVIANSKARLAGIWFLLGLVFGIFALIVITVLPSQARDPNAPSPDTHVKCPDCREFVLKGASVCKHCRCKLVPQT
jgi:hypothetical protein